MLGGASFAEVAGDVVEAPEQRLVEPRGLPKFRAVGSAGLQQVVERGQALSHLTVGQKRRRGFWQRSGRGGKPLSRPVSFSANETQGGGKVF